MKHMTATSIEAQNLLMDLKNGCMMTGYRNGAPRIVMPPLGGRVPHTNGQVSDAAVRQVNISRIAALILRQRCEQAGWPVTPTTTVVRSV
jgi:hypothetical protein